MYPSPAWRRAIEGQQSPPAHAPPLAWSSGVMRKKPMSPPLYVGSCWRFSVADVPAGSVHWIMTWRSVAAGGARRRVVPAEDVLELRRAARLNGERLGARRVERLGEDLRLRRRIQAGMVGGDARVVVRVVPERGLAGAVRPRVARGGAPGTGRADVADAPLRARAGEHREEAGRLVAAAPHRRGDRRAVRLREGERARAEREGGESERSDGEGSHAHGDSLVSDAKNGYYAKPAWSTRGNVGVTWKSVDAARQPGRHEGGNR